MLASIGSRLKGRAASPASPATATYGVAVGGFARRQGRCVRDFPHCSGVIIAAQGPAQRKSVVVGRGGPVSARGGRGGQQARARPRGTPVLVLSMAVVVCVGAAVWGRGGGGGGGGARVPTVGARVARRASTSSSGGIALIVV